MTAVAEFDVRRFMNRPDWMDDANCRGLNPDMFLPVEHLQKPAGARILAEAREVCRRCDVQAECLAYALNGRETGIWAGTTGDQRRRILRAQNRRGPLPTPPRTWSSMSTTRPAATAPTATTAPTRVLPAGEHTPTNNTTSARRGQD